MPAPAQVPVLVYKFEEESSRVTVFMVNGLLCERPSGLDRETLADFTVDGDGAELLRKVYELSPTIERAYTHLFKVGVQLDDWHMRYPVVEMVAKLLSDWLGLDRIHQLADYDQLGNLPLWATRPSEFVAGHYGF